MTSKRKYSRGYAVAILVGFEESIVGLWEVFSKVAKPIAVVELEGDRNDPKAVYNFNEKIVNILRPTLKEGVRSIILASPPRTDYTKVFINHVNKHHAWLTRSENKIAITETTGSAVTPSEVASLTRSPDFQRLIREAASEETGGLLDLLEKRLNTSNRETAVLFSLEEAENLILYSPKNALQKPEYLILTDKYLANSRQKNSLQRLMQIAVNKNVKTRVIDAESPAGKRIAQFGGFVCLTKTE